MSKTIIVSMSVFVSARFLSVLMCLTSLFFLNININSMFRKYMFLIFWYLVCIPDDVDLKISTARVLGNEKCSYFY